MSSTIATALGTAREKIASADAHILLRYVLTVPAVELLAHPERELTAEQQQRFMHMLERRVLGEPVAYLTGIREFFGRPFKVTPATLIPRPETELLVEFALEQLQDKGHVLDLGTGSGCVAISIAGERPSLSVTAIDISTEALGIAQENAHTLAADRIKFLLSDWFTALAGKNFDVIVANPPYVAAGDPHLTQGDVCHEPQSALVAGTDGLDNIRRIVAEAPHYLNHGGWLGFEHGYDQGERCRELLAAAGFVRVFTRRDLAGLERISGGVLP
jgi:release factor glutamine methyltransferase